VGRECSPRTGRTVWAANDADGSVSAIDARSLSVRRVIPANTAASDISAGQGSVWLLSVQPPKLVLVDAAYRAVADRIRLAPGIRGRAGQPGVDVGRGAVWATDGTTRLTKLDPEDGRVIGGFDLRQPLDDVAEGAGALWVVSAASRQVLEVDPRSGSVGARIPISGRSGPTGPAPVAVVAGEGAVWVLNADSPSLTRIDPRDATVKATIPLGVGSNPTAIAIGAGAVWVALTGDGAIARLDARSDDVEKIDVGGAPTGVATRTRAVSICRFSSTTDALSPVPPMSIASVRLCPMSAMRPSECQPRFRRFTCSDRPPSR